MKFLYLDTVFETVKYKGKWSVKSKRYGVLALKPYRTEKQLIRFLIDAGAKKI